MLDIQELHVSYGAIQAVRDVSLTTRRTGITAIIGPNGAGKSSTLAAIAGTVPSEGVIKLNGEAISGLSPERIARHGVLLVPEGRHLFPSLTVDENLRAGLTARGSRPARFSVDDVCDLFPPLGPLRRRPAWGLSGGEQQMCAIGRALVGSPILLMVDEPSLGLSPLITGMLFDVLAQLGSELAILVVEQNTTVALSVATDAYVLVQGRVVLAGEQALSAKGSALMDSYLG